MGKRKKTIADSISSDPTKRNKLNETSTIPKETIKQSSSKVASSTTSRPATDPVTPPTAIAQTIQITKETHSSLANEEFENGSIYVSNDLNHAQSQDGSEKTLTSSSSLSSTTGIPKLMVPRAVIASGLVPRQVARAKVSPAKSSLKSPIARKTESLLSDSTGTIFRARDIINHNPLTTSPETMNLESPILPQSNNTTTGNIYLSSWSNNISRTRFRTFMRDPHPQSSQISNGSTTSSYGGHGYGDNSNWNEQTTISDYEDQRKTWTRPSPGAGVSTSFGSSSTLSNSTSTTRMIKTTTSGNSDTIIRAERIIARPENRKGQFAYPFGNYPNYYEKRTQEQTNGNAPSKAEVSRSIPNHKRTDRWKTTPSVLFGSATNKGLSSVEELAKKVDLRLEFLEPSWFRGKKVLDIGCNAALLTVFIALHYKPSKIQGVDIDASLIGKAQTFVLKTFSQISPQAYTQTRSVKKKKSKKKDDDDEDVKYEAYFPKALHRIHGFLGVPESTTKTEKLFPHNIEFRVADWATEQGDQEANSGQWDVILGFSLTKWIHLHHGDEGMKRFFQKVYRSLTPGGIFLLEAQAYNTYNRRSKITKEMEATYKSIVFRPEEFQEYLLSKDVGFKECIHLGHSEGQAKNFNRDMFLYRK
ncbi:hypothetical protein BGZ49_002475 [Haplosporangium sp. Z 27]|nr:hypothetical protein BGZ49_002475 [Haplosporangium sp. Z 27]